MTGPSKRRLVIDSRYRLPGQEPDEYTVKLTEPMGRVKDIAMIASHVPFCAPTIARGNDTIDVYTYADAGRTHSLATMRHGPVANTADLVSVVQAALPSGMTVSLEGDTGRLTFACNATPFAIGGSGSVVRLIGLRPGLSTGHAKSTQGGLRSAPVGTTNAATAPYPPDLTPEPYLVLRSGVGGSIEAPEQAVNDALAILSPDRVDVAHPTVSKTTKSEFHRMAFKITRPTGEPYDFGGRDHRLEFDIE
jgi:hypothetical protein